MTNTTPTYTTRGDSLPARVIAFFRANPDEQLTAQDIADKFNTSYKGVHTNLHLAVQAHQLHRSRTDEGEYIYSIAGGHIVDPDRAPTPAAQPAKPKKATGYASPRHELLDFDALTVEEGVPYSNLGNRKGQDKWDPLFAKLKKPGQSLVIPITVRTAVGAAATKRNRLKTKGTFRVAMISANAARVWRLA